MADHRSNERQQRRRRAGGYWWARRGRVMSAVVGVIMAGSLAFAVTNWTVGLNGGSSGQSQSETVSNLTIVAVATPAASNLLYPGSNGDVVLQITNPNHFPVTITALSLPANTTYATGYSDSGLSSTQAGCDNTASLVSWRFATGVSGSSHTLTSALTVAASGQANNPLKVTLTNMGSMGSASPAACENTYFKMASLAGVTATSDDPSAVATTTPATDAWTS